ncbi:hypothetical protein KTH40_10230 [Acinetobacter haemolyticus]|uniref:hypothetical protein n=1 Tax=Acinetobacter haemolyticus TaxID=29430 RepID=UPI0021D2A121|nr:hypothetical protein [Acinetobacter haemolyticus]MCU4387979.1 hypothetical protein [Acinetobacter haemolyticus]
MPKTINEENQLNNIQYWLSEISLLDGKCCYKSKVSDLRAKLVTIIDINQSESLNILKIFDEKVWINNGNIYEINSDELVYFQNEVSRIYTNRVYKEKIGFDLKKEVFVFTLNQSTLLALYIATIFFTKMIWKNFSHVHYLDVSLVVGYFLTIFVVVYIIDKTTKNLMLILGSSLFLILSGSYAYFIYLQKSMVYLDFSDTFRLGFIIFLNLAMFGAYLFSSLYSINIFIDNKINTPRLVFFIIGVILYGVVIGAGLQGVMTKI